MKKALIIVDVQQDFCEGGRLAVAGGNGIVPLINRQMNIEKYDYIVATKDFHPENHQSFASEHGMKETDFGEGEVGGVKQMLWPVHCVQGSDGAEFHKDLEDRKVNLMITKGTNPNVDSYSAFMENDKKSSTGLAELLKGIGIEEVDVVGLALDVCVKFTCEDALKAGFKTNLLLDMAKAVDPSGVDGVVDSLKEQGVVVK